MLRNLTIYGDRKDKENLEKLGVRVGEYKGAKYTNCLVNDSAMEKLDPMWGLLIWKEVKKTAKEPK